MTAPTREEELAALRRPFLLGVLLVLLGVAAIGVVIARFGSNADRPAGIAERWLVAVGDTTRDGVEEDARERIVELSVDGIDLEAVTALAALSETAGAEGASAFEGVRVGPPVEEGIESALVPATLTPRDGDEVRLHIALRRADGGDWKVVAPVTLDAATGGCDEASCPGFPIERPERAPIGWFVGALALGVVITLGCIAAVRAATPTPT